MAFIQFKFDQVTRQTRDIFNTYIYETDDTIAEVLVTGYFDACRFANSPDWVGSIIQCKCSDTYAELYALAGGATELVMPAAAVVAANVQTLADAVAYAESGLQVNGIVTTVEYNADTGIGGNTYQKIDAGSSGARPAEDGGSVIHLTGGSGGLYLKGLFLSGCNINQFGCIPGVSDSGVKIQNAIDYLFNIGGGKLETNMGLGYSTSTQIRIKRGVNFGSDGYFNVRNREVKQYGLTKIEALSGFTGDILTLDVDAEGAQVRGLHIKALLQASGNAMTVEGLTTADTARTSAIISNIMIEGGAANGIRFKDGLGGLKVSDIYAYNAVFDCIVIDSKCVDFLFDRVFASNSQTARGIIWSGNSCRAYNVDVWSNSTQGMVLDGGNNDFIRFQSDLNGTEGLEVTNTLGTRKRNNFSLISILENSKSSAGAFSDVKISADVRGLTFNGGTIGAYPAVALSANAKYGVEYLGTDDKCVKMVGVNLPTDVFEVAALNGQAAKWIQKTAVNDCGDSMPGNILSDFTKSENLVANPDFYNSGAGWSVFAGAIWAATYDTAVGTTATVTPTTASTDQFIDLDILTDAEKYRGRKVSVGFIYKKEIADTQIKNVILRIGSTPARTVQLKNLGEYVAGYVGYKILSTQTGVIRIRIEVKKAGQGAHQEPIELSNFRCVIL